MDYILKKMLNGASYLAEIRLTAQQQSRKYSCYL